MDLVHQPLQDPVYMYCTCTRVRKHPANVISHWNQWHATINPLSHY